MKSILLYHVAGQRLYSGNVAAMPFIPTLNGATAQVTVRHNQGYLDNARFVATDILATNGGIHVIDAVILPPAK